MSKKDTHKEIEDVEITNSITLHILGIVGEAGSEERMDNVEKAVDNIEAIMGKQITSAQSQVLDRAIKVVEGQEAKVEIDGKEYPFIDPHNLKQALLSLKEGYDGLYHHFWCEFCEAKFVGYIGKCPECGERAAIDDAVIKTPKTNKNR